MGRQERLSLGLDFGTSNSSAGLYEEGNLRVVENEQGEQSQPSSIFIRVDGYHSTGYQSVQDFLDPKAHTDTCHFIPSVKPGLPIRNYEGVVLRSHRMLPGRKYETKYFSVEGLASILITDLKLRAEKFFDCPAEKVVIGRPVVFSGNQEEDKLAEARLEKAAKMSGFKEVGFVMEPIAAALYYERFFYDRKEDKTLFVFDFGGGTLDTCVLRLGKDSSSGKALSDKVVASHGIDLGGTDLDKDVFRDLFLEYFGQMTTFNPQGIGMPNNVFDDITEWHLMQPERERQLLETLRLISSDPVCSDRNAVLRLTTLVQNQGVFALLRVIEQAKMDANDKGSGQIKYKEGCIDIFHLMSVEDYQRSIGVRIQEAEECIMECLNRAQVKPEEIDIILKTGGSSNNLFVDQLLARVFRKGKIQSSDIFTSVVAGLSIAAADLYLK